MEPFFPLGVFVCSNCQLVQLPEFESPEDIFGGEYLYFSSYSESWLRHCEAYTVKMIERFGLGSESKVVELASNDGYLLQYFAQRGVPVLGVEPAANVAKVALEERGIPTEVCFFNLETAQRLRAEGHVANLIAANNVLAHVPDLHGFVAGIAHLLADDGVATLEFPHLMRLIEGKQFDTIYHEHFSYLSFHVVVRAFREHGLTVFDVEELPTHGGSLRVYAGLASGSPNVSEAVTSLLAREREAGYQSMEIYQDFHEQVQAIKRDLLEFLIAAKRDGKRIVGYGAAAKGNTLLNYCGIRADFIDVVADRSPHKQGCFLPGTHIPVVAPEDIDALKPDYVLILPWNLRDEITAQLSHIRDWGGRCVVAIPQLEVIDA